jgi:spore germination cell wall hydrolase CwlJ-like protein
MTFEDFEMLVRTVWAEARGEPRLGQIGVAKVIMSRAADENNRWPKSVAEVCTQPWQFSCWNENDPNREKLLRIDLDNKLVRVVAKTCLEAVDSDDPTHGANHYFADYIAQPSWADQMQKTATIGRHLFFKA